MNKRKSTVLVLALVLLCLASLPARAIEIQSGIPSPTVASMGDPTQYDASDEPTNANTTTVGFGGKQWKVIGYKPAGGTYSGVLDAGGGALPTVDSYMTLLLANGYTYPSDTTFGSDYVYNGSALKTAMEGAYGTLSAAEQGLVLARDLSIGNYNGTMANWCDGVMTTAVTGANFWPLSTREASYVPTPVRAFRAF